MMEILRPKIASRNNSNKQQTRFMAFVQVEMATEQ